MTDTNYIDFSDENDNDDDDYENGQLVRDLINGKLPGKLGVAQSLFTNWSIPSTERNIVRYGRAVLDSIATILAYKESKKIIIKANDPIYEWFKANQYVKYQANLDITNNFILQIISSLPCNTRKFKNSDSAINEYQATIDNKSFKFYTASWSKNKNTLTIPDGPYFKVEDTKLFKIFIHNCVWERLKSNTAILSLNKDDTGGNPYRISALSDDIDFISAKDQWNDIKLLSQRCNKFLEKGLSRTMLFFGPPGTGKSTMARAIAKELNLKTLLIEGRLSESMSDAAFLQIVDLINPGMLIVNDVDRMYDRMNIMLEAFENFDRERTKGCINCLTINDIDSLDPALLRPGRISEIREIPEPSVNSRKLILNYYLEKFNISCTSEQINKFLKLSDNFSPADVREFCETAKALDFDPALEEIDRIIKQREYYNGTKCGEYLQSAPTSIRKRKRKTRF